MKQTEHYGLNQWELTDQIKMADFNADNAKIAAALAGKMGKLEPSYIFPSDTGFSRATFRILPYPTEWTDWAITIAHFHTSNPESKALDTMELRLGGGEPLLTLPGGPILVITAPLHDPSRNIQGLIIADNVIKLFHTDIPFEGTDSMDLRNGEHAAPNFTMSYGIR